MTAPTLITGGAGFIGSQVAAALLQQRRPVRILDSLDPFYDVTIKRRNVESLRERFAEVEFHHGDIRDDRACARACSGVGGVIHLAALAGVRPSIQDPVRYMDVNVTGTQRLLRHVASGVPFVFGSSSSIYGGNEKVPFSESDPVDHPVSPYAASKKAGEVLCHTFHHLNKNPVTCLRFFTVYGPGQRPEMAIHMFTRLIAAGQPVPFFGDGSTRRDYTYVTDIVDGVVRALDRARGYRIYNLGGAATTTLQELVTMLEQILGKKANLDRRPDQPGDVPVTYADTTLAEKDLGYHARVPIRSGLQLFCDWYRAERTAGRVA